MTRGEFGYQGIGSAGHCPCGHHGPGAVTAEMFKMPLSYLHKEVIYLPLLVTNGVPGREVRHPGRVASQKALKRKFFQVQGVNPAHPREVVHW